MKKMLLHNSWVKEAIILNITKKKVSQKILIKIWMRGYS